MNNALAPAPIFRRHWLPLELAIQRVVRFEHEFGKAHLALACHAALPSILTPDLVNLIRINFLEKSVEWIAESDLLLSSLCLPINQSVFEIEPQIRQVLLVALQIDPNYGFERLEELAYFLYDYTQSPLIRDLPPHSRRLYQWLSCAYLDPDLTIQSMFDFLNTTKQKDPTSNIADPLQVGKALAMIANPLEMTNLQVELEDLVDYTQNLALYWYGDIKNLITNLQSDSESRDEVTHVLTSSLLDWFETLEPSAHTRGLQETLSALKIKRGDLVEGVITRIDQDRVLVDIGLKLEGIIFNRELPGSGYGSLNELHLNDRVLVYVLQPETAENPALLSLKRGNIERQWRIAQDQYNNGELLEAKVIDFNKGGLIVDIGGIRGFVPTSQILNIKREEIEAGGESQEMAARFQSMKGKELRLKIIEINHARNRLVLSERMGMQQWREQRFNELLEELKPGEIREGVVSNLADFGAFVDIGGTDGLVHISQIGWSRIKHPNEILQVGQEVKVKVLSVDKKNKKIALSIKQAGFDPWTTVEQRYKPDQMVTGTITKVAPFGAFVRIEDGIEGLLHFSELTPGLDPKTALSEGAQWQMRILRIDAPRRRLGLSMRQADEVDTNE